MADAGLKIGVEGEREFKKALSGINEEMKLAAAYAIADLVSADKLCPEYILPEAFDERVGPAVAKAVGKAARNCGIARI